MRQLEKRMTDVSGTYRKQRVKEWRGVDEHPKSKSDGEQERRQAREGVMRLSVSGDIILEVLHLGRL